MYQAIKITGLSLVYGILLGASTISNNLWGSSCPCVPARIQCNSNCVGANPPLPQDLTSAQTACLDKCRSTAESCFSAYLDETGLTCE